jgi:hypothetical protein
MTNKEKAQVICQMRYDGRSYSSISKELGVSKPECYRLFRLDFRVKVVMRCKTCRMSWVEWKMPESKERFDCCAVCATVKWERSLVLEREEARAGVC